LGTSYAQVVDLAGYADKEPAWVRDALLGETTLRDAQLKGNAPPQQQQKTEEVRERGRPHRAPPQLRGVAAQPFARAAGGASTRQHAAARGSTAGEG